MNILLEIEDIIILIFITGLLLFTWLIINKYYNKIKELENKKEVYSDLNYKLLSNMILSLRSLYITNRIIEANNYLTFIEIYIDDLKNKKTYSKNQIKNILNNVLKLKDLLISLNTFRGYQSKVIESILTKIY